MNPSVTAWIRGFAPAFGVNPSRECGNAHGLLFPPRVQNGFLHGARIPCGFGWIRDRTSVMHRCAVWFGQCRTWASVSSSSSTRSTRSVPSVDVTLIHPAGCGSTIALHAGRSYAVVERGFLRLCKACLSCTVLEAQTLDAGVVVARVCGLQATKTWRRAILINATGQSRVTLSLRQGP